MKTIDMVLILIISTIVIGIWLVFFNDRSSLSEFQQRCAARGGITVQIAYSDQLGCVQEIR